MGYTDQTLITGYLKRNLSEAEATIAKTVIDSVTAYIDTETGQSWSTTDAGVAKLYEGGEKILFIDPIIDIESVEHVNDEGEVLDTYSSTSYTAFPMNADTKTSLEVFRRWPRGLIRVTGKWGKAGGIPSDIQLAATILASSVFNNQTGDIKSESIEGYSVTYADVKVNNQQVRDILDGHRSIRI